MVSGYITRIDFSDNKEKALVEIDGNSGILFEFRNTSRKKRADHVKKMGFKVGEYCVASGACDAGKTFSYGYEIERDGTVSSGEILVTVGNIRKIIHTPRFDIVSYFCNEKEFHIKIGKALSHTRNIQKGKCSFICYKVNKSKCIKECDHMNYVKCKSCLKKKKTTEMVAYDLKIIGGNDEY